jgi:hypothetical protein
MQTDDKERKPSTWSLHAVSPCCANVWDSGVDSYRPCDEMADPASELELCVNHHARLTSILSLIDAAQTAAKVRGFAS